MVEDSPTMDLPNLAKPVDTTSLEHSSVLENLRIAVSAHCIKFHESFTKEGHVLDWCIDLRELLYRPVYLKSATELMWERIKHLQPDFIGGMTMSAEQITGGLLQAALRDGRELAGFSVRRIPKAYGTRRQVEGVNPTPGSRVVLVDDLIDSGRAIADVMKLMREGRANVVGVATVVDFRNPGCSVMLEASVHRVALFGLQDFGLAKPAKNVRLKQPLWVRADLNRSAYTAPQSTPCVGDRSFVAAGDRGLVIAWDTEGRELWRFETGDCERGVRAGVERVESAILVAGYDGYLYRLRGDNGRPEWSVKVGAFVAASLAVDQDRGVAFVAANHKQRASDFLAVDLANGDILWRSSAAAWSYARPALVARDGVVFAANDGTVRLLDRSDGTVRWATRLGAQVKGWIAAGVDSCFCGTFDGFACALAVSDGRLIWRRRLSEWLLSHPVLLEGTIIMSTGSHLGAFDVGTGALRWACPSGRVTGSAVTPDRSRIVCANDAGDCFCVDLHSVEYRWRFRAPGPFRATPAVTNELCVIPCYDGAVYAFNLD
jgi:orotate phosphoribosyltransferase